MSMTYGVVRRLMPSFIVLSAPSWPETSKDSNGRRIIAIGDIHGCSVALAALLWAIDPQPDDTIVALGDFVDRGLDSKGVLDQLIALADRYRLVPLLGNHDEMMLNARNGKDDFRFWMNCGGITSLDSYGSSGQLDLVPAAHFHFLERCLRYFETDTHMFIHANYKPDVPLDKQDDHTLRWLSLRDFVPGPHFSGKIAVVGHTPQPDLLDLGHLVCIDTGCCKGGWLTALDVVSGRKWQADERGHHRQ
jgi:serine/threonine protein phosphatase 1